MKNKTFPCGKCAIWTVALPSKRKAFRALTIVAMEIAFVKKYRKTLYSKNGTIKTHKIEKEKPRKWPSDLAELYGKGSVWPRLLNVLLNKRLKVVRRKLVYKHVNCFIGISLSHWNRVRVSSRRRHLLWNNGSALTVLYLNCLTFLNVQQKTACRLNWLWAFCIDRDL